MEQTVSRIPKSVFLYTAIGAGAGVLALSAMNFSNSTTTINTTGNSSRTTERKREGSVVVAGDAAFPATVKSRLTGTYGYLFASLATTAAAAGLMFRSGAAHRLMAMNPMVVGIGGMVAMIGTMMLTRSIDYHSNPVGKHIALAGFIGAQALMMSPLAAVGGALLMRAAVATGCIVGSISLVAATAPSQAYLNMTGPLAIGFGLVAGASLGSLFFPGAQFLYSIVMWGGLAFHGGMVFYRTQGLIDTAHMKRRHDPINDMMGIYIDSMAIFWRMVMLMSGGGNKKRR